MTSAKPTHTDIQTLLETQTYNPAIVPQLELYVERQSDACSPQPYYLDANRTLVKLYQFFPHLIKSENVALVELLALVYGQSSEGQVDFGLLGCLIHESVKKEEPFPTLARCADLLDACQFRDFWIEFSAIPTLPSAPSYPKVSALVESAHVKTQIRRSVLTTLSLTYRTASLISVVLPSLNFETDDQLMEFITTDAVAKTVVDGVADGKVSFFARAENTKRNKVFQEGVDYGVIRSLVKKTAVIAARE